ncbi:MAG TPA: hypothetical protein VGG16_05995 [Streptosporangiaceae bacterium]
MSPDRVVPGQVVSEDSDDVSPQPQETFLHKVASGPLGPVGANTAGRHARTGEAGLADGNGVNGSAEAATDDDDTAADDTANADTAYRNPAYDDAADDDTEVIAESGVAVAPGDAAYAGDTETASDAEPGNEARADYSTDVDDADTDEAPAIDEPPMVDEAEAPVVEAPVVDEAEADASDAGIPASATTDTDVTDVPDVPEVTPATDDVGAVNGTGVMSGSDVADTRTDVPVVRAAAGQAADEPLLGEAAGGIREEWRQVQASFVDDPQASVTAAAAVVADAAARLEALLRERQRGLRASWDGNGQADTETLRQAMLTYRRLLTKLIS